MNESSFAIQSAVAELFPLIADGEGLPDQTGSIWIRVPQGSDGRWTHLIEVRRNGVLERYVDGVRVL